MYLRVTASAENVDKAEELLAPVVDKIQNLLGDYIYGIDAKNLETAVVLNLKEKGLCVATAESCTGGWVSKLITNVEGASDVFGCGVCAYSNEIKIKVLGVREEDASKIRCGFRTDCRRDGGGRPPNIRRRYRDFGNRHRGSRRRQRGKTGRAGLSGDRTVPLIRIRSN